MAIISEEHGFLFIQTPRTGSTALAEGALVPQLDGRHFPKGEVRTADGTMIPGKHATLPQLLQNGLLDAPTTDAMLVFTTVRNPFDRLVSAYEGKRKNVDLLDEDESWVQRKKHAVEEITFAVDHSFAEWVELRFQRRGRLGRRRGPTPRHMTDKWLEGTDAALRFEHLQADFDELLGRLGVDEPITIPKLNVTEGREGRSYRDYYDAATRDLVARAFAPDLERFGYEF